MTGDDQRPRPAGLLPCDLAVLNILASGRPAVAAGEQLSMPLAMVVVRLQHIRAHYNVRSTAAALQQAAAHGDLNCALPQDHQDGGDDGDD